MSGGRVAPSVTHGYTKRNLLRSIAQTQFASGLFYARVVIVALAAAGFAACAAPRPGRCAAGLFMNESDDPTVGVVCVW